MPHRDRNQFLDFSNCHSSRYADNKLDFLSVSVVLSPLVASHIVVKPQTHPKLVIDDVSDITLFCEAVGYPHPVVSWIKPSGVFVSSLTVTGKQNTAMSALRVGGLQEAGTYTCIAFNSIGRDTAQATVFG